MDHLKTVIVFLHGGGFVTGAGSSLLYGPDYLIDENVVVVTVQSRLSAFGFLSTESDEARGNFGLHDQLLALKYVQNHIASFGGDPGRVTLMGEGAGAASASLLSLTDRSKGLFKNLILIGGTGLNSQYFQRSPVESARELASRLECSYEDFSGLVSCLRSADTEKIVRQVGEMFSFFSFPRWFAPSVDGVLLGKEPEKLMEDGKMAKVPVLLGSGKHEGAFYYPLTLNSFNDGKYDGEFIDGRLPRLLPVISEFESKLLPLTKAIRKRYFTNIDIDNEDEFRPRYIELLTDLLYNRFSSKYGRLLQNANIPVYNFQFEYFGTNSIMQMLGEPAESKYAAHGDILQYIFTQVLGEDKVLPEEDLTFATSIFVPFIVNFAKTGNPTPPSSATAFEDFQCPKLGDEGQVCSLGKSLSVIPKFRANILKFWDQEVNKIYGKQIKEEL